MLCQDLNSENQKTVEYDIKAVISVFNADRQQIFSLVTYLITYGGKWARLKIKPLKKGK